MEQLTKEICSLLIERAFEARKKAYCPYSQFAVGAALLSGDGQVFCGCNVENAAAGSNCAERTAIYKAVSEGERQFQAIAIVGGHKHKQAGGLELCYPCGVCRQVMSEFCGQDFSVIVAKDKAEYKIYTLKELLPYAFSL